MPVSNRFAARASTFKMRSMRLAPPISGQRGLFALSLFVLLCPVAIHATWAQVFSVDSASPLKRPADLFTPGPTEVVQKIYIRSRKTLVYYLGIRPECAIHLRSEQAAREILAMRFFARRLFGPRTKAARVGVSAA